MDKINKWELCFVLASIEKFTWAYIISDLSVKKPYINTLWGIISEIRDHNKQLSKIKSKSADSDPEFDAD